MSMPSNLSKFIKTLNILYVEDDLDVMESMREVLESIFKSISFATNGKDGLELLKKDKDKIDFVLSDINMPQMDGLEMSQKIRELDVDIPIVFLTAFTETDKILKSIELNIDGYIIKPIKFDSFLNTINKVAKKLYLVKQNLEYKCNLERKVQEQTKELTQQNQELKFRYYHDKLTLLPNRNAFIKDIEQFNNPKLMLVDISKFSTINSIYGHIVGDEILKQVAELLVKNKLNNCIAYRIAADQFVLVNDDKNISCDYMMERISDSIFREPLVVDIDNFKVTVQISVVISMVADIKNKNLLDYADMALKYAKKTYQPYVIYTPELNMNKNYKKTIKAIEMVKSAMASDNLVPFFQPIIKDNETSYECLVRIIDDDTVVSPFYFLEEIKRTSYYTKLTKIMIDKSFEYFEDKDSSFSINLSFEDILNQQIIEHLIEKLQKTDMSKQLIIEILESEFIENFDVVKKFISKMKKFGVRIAIDDFGSGYSNFVYLHELMPDYLKIDGSLIKDIDTNKKSYIIVKTIVAFAKELGIEIVAEFVHNEAVYNKMLELGVKGMQGYYLGKPSRNTEYPYERDIV